MKILKKLCKFNWIKMNILYLLDFFFKSSNFWDKKWQSLKNDYDFFSRKIIIQLVRVKNENIRSILNENFILFWSVLLLIIKAL